MKQLSGMDAAFLYMETPNTYGHVNGLAIYDRPSADFDPFAVVYARFGTLVGHLEPLRRRVVEVPFGLDHPYWVDDPHFDLDFHIRQIALPEPGADDQLAEQVARIIGRPMDRRHPLWEVYVMEGLADDRWAVFTKFHHATIDGASGVLMLKLVTATEPDADWPFEPVSWAPGQIPSDREMLSRAVNRLVTNPVRAARLGLNVVRNVADAAGLNSVSGVASRSREVVGAVTRRSSESSDIAEQLRRVSMPLTPAPPTPWNKSVGPHRRFAMRHSKLANIKRLKDATGGTVNDVVMAISAGALREYLIEHDALPDVPLRAMVPVSIRTGDEADPWTNRVSGIVAELPTDCDDPLERVARCKVAMEDAKRQLDLMPADAIINASDTTSPVVATAAVRLQARLADRLPVPVNVVISNVPGPREALYFDEAKLRHYVPVSTITNGMGLNITVHSYEDELDFGLVADRDLVPDLWRLVDLHIAEMERLFEASGAEWAVPPGAPPLMRGKPGAPTTAANGTEQRGAEKRSAKKRSAKKRSTKKSGKQGASGSARASSPTKGSKAAS